nr:HAD hydrolase family protein [Alistipes finegoldii]
MGNFKEDIVRTEAFVFDVDGVMTDGGIIPTLDGDFIRRYNAKDGYALAYAIKMGYKVCIITGGRGKTLENRLKMLGVTRAYIDCMDKISALHEYFAEEGIDPRNAIYMGDDIPDLECMREVGIPVCPADAAAEVIEASRYVSEFKGGEGARHRRAGAPRPRRLGQKLRRRDSLVAGRLAVSLLPGTDGTDNQDKRDKTRKRQAAHLQTKKQPVA